MTSCEMHLLRNQLSTWMDAPWRRRLCHVHISRQGKFKNKRANEQPYFSQGRLTAVRLQSWGRGGVSVLVTVTVGQELSQAPGSLTHCFYLHMDEGLDVVLQGLMGLQGDGQVAVVLSVAEVHLDAWGPKRGTKPTNQKTTLLSSVVITMEKEAALWLVLGLALILNK